MALSKDEIIAAIEQMNLLDIVATEVAVGWTERSVINPGPHQFHSEAACWPPHCWRTGAAGCGSWR